MPLGRESSFSGDGHEKPSGTKSTVSQIVDVHSGKRLSVFSGVDRSYN